MIKRIQIQIPPDYCPDDLSRVVAEKSGINNPFYIISSRSLDARKADNIHYFLNINVSASPIPDPESLNIPLIKRKTSAVVVGLGPAGYFAALVLSLAGVSVTVVEKGKDVCERESDIQRFEDGGPLVDNSNYLFGEGGAGTFSDGKLTSRSKRISSEKDFVLNTYIKAGADPEIEFDVHPHLGSDRLRKMMPELRKILCRQNVQILFETEFKSFINKNSRFIVKTSKGTMESDLLFVAPGHSSYNTYRSLIRSNVIFKAKPFAAGFRVEHPQILINRAQWKRDSLPGIRSAEYRLSYINGDTRVYSFCMCPGGNIVPAAASEGHSAVNGASNYARDGKYANAAIVSAFTLDSRLNREVSPLEIIDYVEDQTSLLYNCTKSYNMPAAKIDDFLKNRVSSVLPKSSYPFETVPYDYNMIFDNRLCSDLRAGLKDFCKKIKGFEQGIIVGSEYTTSAPVQCSRDRNGEADNFENLYICGEGSGFAGGIISSAADGVRSALSAVCKICD